MPSPSLLDYQYYRDRRALEQPVPRHPTPLVSIITVTLNAAATLERTIGSVHEQALPRTEHIFIDGGSTDGTIDLIRRSARAQDYWISEKDRGISDAFNKGVAMARGHFVQILNADDWLSANQLQTGVAALQETGADFVFGDLLFYEHDRPTFTYVGDPDYARIIHRRMPAINHPTVLAERRCFERVGLFDLAYRNAMDYDWLLRLHLAEMRGVYRSAIIGHMTHDGVSNRQYKRTIEEVRKITTANGRNGWLAGAEAEARYLKTAISRPIKQTAKPIYQIIRRIINPAYRPRSLD